MSELPVPIPDQTLSESQLPPSAPLSPVTLSTPPSADVPQTSHKAKQATANPPVSERLGRFEVHSEIGRGGMGAVLRGRDPALGRDLAIKVMLAGRQGNADALRRFHEEAQIGGQLQHPGLVPVYEMGVDDDGRPFFAMKLVDGKTLAALLKERTSPADNLPRFLTIFEQVCQALAYAHARGVIHRDLKPANVMVGAFGEVQVMDWGLAKVLGSKGSVAVVEGSVGTGGSTIHTARTDSSGSESRDGSVMGTPAYMPPEQARGEIDRLDQRSDVFGLGAILCEVLTGQPAFIGQNASEILGRSASGDLTETFVRLDACGVDQELVRLAKACLAAEPASRPTDGSVIAAQVAAHRASVEERLRNSELERTAAEVKAQEERKRRRLALALAAAVVLMLALGGSALAWIRQQRLEYEADRLRQEAELVRQTENDLSRAALARQEKKWPDAWKAVERAEERLASGGSEELRERVRQARAELEQVRKDQMMVARLIEARLRVSETDPYLAKSGNAADTAFREAFAEYGLDVENLTPELAGEKIRNSAIRAELVFALYDWSRATIEGVKITPRSWRLAHLGADNDSDPRAKQFLGALEQKDWATVLRLFEQVDPAQISPALAWHLADDLRYAGKAEKAVALLQEVQRRHPDDFLINFELARSYLYDAKPSRPDEAARYFTAASVLQPKNARVYVQLGNALINQNKYPEAIVAYREAINLKPDYASAHFNLGSALQGNWMLAESETAFREGLRLDPDSWFGHNNLGVTLRNQGKWSGAAAEYKEAIRLNPDHALPQFNLGFVLRRQGKFTDSLVSYRRAHELGPRTKWSTTSSQTSKEVRSAERLVELESRLPALRNGETKPADANEEMELSTLCMYKQLYAASVEFFRKGLRDKPTLAASHIFFAAYSAARAGSGQGEDAAALSESERADLRNQALDWFRAGLILLQKLAASENPRDRTTLVQIIRFSQNDVELAAVRDADALAKLPEDERAKWHKLWQDVEALLKRAAAPK